MYVLGVFNEKLYLGFNLFAGLDIRANSTTGIFAEPVLSLQNGVRNIKAIIYFDYEQASNEALRFNAIVKSTGRVDPKLTVINLKDLPHFVNIDDRESSQEEVSSSVTFFNYHPGDVVKEEHICYYTVQHNDKCRLIQVYKEFVKNQNGGSSILMEKICTRQVKECSVYAVSNSEVFLMMHAQAVCRKLA